jgi:Holliday junction resolvasome RuvABC ATP-dependent DNA helicase subunit
MNSVSFHRDFVAAGASAHRPRGEPGLARRSLLRRVLDAIDLSHRRTVEREIARALGLGNPDGRFTDQIERRLFEHLTGDRGYRP